MERRRPFTNFRASAERGKGGRHVFLVGKGILVKLVKKNLWLFLGFLTGKRERRGSFFWGGFSTDAGKKGKTEISQSEGGKKNEKYFYTIGEKRRPCLRGEKGAGRGGEKKNRLIFREERHANRKWDTL